MRDKFVSTSFACRSTVYPDMHTERACPEERREVQRHRDDHQHNGYKAPIHLHQESMPQLMAKRSRYLVDSGGLAIHHVGIRREREHHHSDPTSRILQSAMISQSSDPSRERKRSMTLASTGDRLQTHQEPRAREVEEAEERHRRGEVRRKNNEA